MTLAFLTMVARPPAVVNRWLIERAVSAPSIWTPGQLPPAAPTVRWLQTPLEMPESDCLRHLIAVAVQFLCNLLVMQSLVPELFPLSTFFSQGLSSRRSTTISSFAVSDVGQRTTRVAGCRSPGVPGRLGY